jgi:tetratricopeptide (TPR) repeat protein
MTPTRIGPYQLLSLLGEGGFARVWHARQDEPLPREVALKLLKPGMDSADVLRRFQQELETLARMDHPHIARVLDAGRTADEHPYIVMELVEDAQPLTRWCEQQKLSPRARLALFLQLCDAVRHAHQNGVIHRDLKPANVLVSGTGQLKVIDFGIAQALAQPADGSSLGTRGYTSPEQLEGKPVDTRADVFSLGAILSEMLGPSPGADLRAIIRRATDSEPAGRYGGADALAEDVQNHLAARPVAARRAGALYVTSRFIRRHRLLVAACLIAACSLACGLYFARQSAALAEQRLREASKASEMLTGLWNAIARQAAPAGSTVTVRDLMQRGDDPASLMPISSRCQLLIAAARVAGTLPDHVLAREAAEKARALILANPTQIPVTEQIEMWTIFGAIESLTGNRQQAIDAFQQAVNAAKDAPPAAQLSARRYLASAFAHAQDERAEQALRAVLKDAADLNLPATETGLLHARADLSQVLLDRQKSAEALALLEEAISHARAAGPAERLNTVRLLLRRGSLLLRQNNPEAGLQAMQQAIQESTQPVPGPDQRK